MRAPISKKTGSDITNGMRIIMDAKIEELARNAYDAFYVIKELIDSSDFLNGKYVGCSDDEIIYDAEKATYYATEQEVEPPFKRWATILEYNTNSSVSTEIKMELPNNGREAVIISDDISTELTNRIITTLSKTDLPSEVGDIACEDFYVFLVEIMYFKKLCAFSQRLFDVYRMGGFPCGWKGEFPEGKLLVFSPQKP